MNLRSLLTILTSLTLFSSLSWGRDKGGLFVEPGITYQASDAKISYPAPITAQSDASNNGFGAMARLGFHISESFFLAADGRYSMATFEDSNNNFNSDSEVYNIAPVLGVQMSEIGLRIWGSAILAGEMDPAETNGVDLLFSEARGYRIGAGFRLFSLSINLEYEDLSYQRSEVSGNLAFFTGPTSDLKLDTESYILSVSFPLEL